MAKDKDLSRQAKAARAARAAGIPDRKDLTLQVVDRRRSQLWTISILVVSALTVAIAVLSVAREYVARVLKFEDFSSWAIVVFVGGLALAFLIYVVEKERSLRSLTKLLVEERVLSAALSNRLAEISTLSEVGKAINTTLEVEDVFDLILSSSISLLGGTEGSIMLLDAEKGELKVVSAQGPNPELVLGMTQRIGDGVGGTVALRRTPMLIQGDSVEDSITLASERPIHSSMSVPLIRRDELVGVLNLNECEGRLRFSDQDLRSLGLFAEHAAIAIGNARLFERERETVSRLEELDRLKSDFVASVSHELKTPLTAIIGAAKTVSRGGSSMPEHEQMNFIAMIERQGRRLLRLVEDVLATAKIESGLTHMRREMLDMRELAEGVLEDLQNTKVGRDRTIDLLTNPDRPEVWADATAVRQILANLIENALKYSEEREPVGVSISETDRQLEIAVTDRGQGISDDHVVRIFDRFRQVETDPGRRVGGFGLGLFIVKNLIEQHGGTVEVDSTVGVGSTFRVILPKRSRSTQAAPPPPPPPQLSAN